MEPRWLLSGMPELVKDINPGSIGSGPDYLTNMNGALYFGAGDGTLAGDAYPFDGLVNISDLNDVRNNFGAGPLAIPEPMSAVLLLFGCMYLAVRRQSRNVNCLR